MKTKINIEYEIEKTLGAYQQQNKPVLNPYFNSRLKARMENAQQQVIYSPARLRLSLVVAVFFVLLNAVSVFSYIQSNSTQMENEALSALTTEFAVEATDIYAYSFDNE